MKKNVINNFIVKAVSLVTAVTLAITPVTTSAATKYVTWNDFLQITKDCLKDKDTPLICNPTTDDVHRTEYMDTAKYVKKIKALDGKYTAKNQKILVSISSDKDKNIDSAVKKITKTGKYTVLFGSTVKTETKFNATYARAGYVRFTAPANGTYKFAFDVSKTLTTNPDDRTGWSNSKLNELDRLDPSGAWFDYKYTYSNMILVQVADVYINHKYASRLNYNYNGEKDSCDSLMAFYLGTDASSKRQQFPSKFYGTIKMKKGQSIEFKLGQTDSSNDVTDHARWEFRSVDLTVSKIK